MLRDSRQERPHDQPTHVENSGPARLADDRERKNRQSILPGRSAAPVASKLRAARSRRLAPRAARPIRIATHGRSSLSLRKKRAKGPIVKSFEVGCATSRRRPLFIAGSFGREQRNDCSRPRRVTARSSSRAASSASAQRRAPEAAWADLDAGGGKRPAYLECRLFLAGAGPHGGRKPAGEQPVTLGTSETFSWSRPSVGRPKPTLALRTHTAPNGTELRE
jgi:hypothetical protein